MNLSDLSESRGTVLSGRENKIWRETVVFSLQLGFLDRTLCGLGPDMNAQRKHEAIESLKTKAQQDALEFFHDPQRKAYATVPVGQHRETWRVKSRDFRLWCTQALYDLRQCASPKTLVTACLEDFETYAVCRGQRHGPGASA